MNAENIWQQFMTSGKIDDYLHYKQKQRELSFSQLKENNNNEHQIKSSYRKRENNWQ